MLKKKNLEDSKTLKTLPTINHGEQGCRRFDADYKQQNQNIYAKFLKPLKRDAAPLRVSIADRVCKFQPKTPLCYLQAISFLQTKDRFARQMTNNTPVRIQLCYFVFWVDLPLLSL